MFLVANDIPVFVARLMGERTVIIRAEQLDEFCFVKVPMVVSIFLGIVKLLRMLKVDIRRMRSHVRVAEELSKVSSEKNK